MNWKTCPSCEGWDLGMLVGICQDKLAASFPSFEVATQQGFTVRLLLTDTTQNA